MRIGQGSHQVGGLQHAQDAESGQGVQAALRSDLRGGQPAKGRSRLAGLAFVEKSLSGPSNPRIWVAQMTDPLSGGHRRETGKPPGRTATRGDAVDATAVLAGTQIQGGPDLLRDVIRVFDDLALHVEQVESAVWSRLQAHRSERRVAAGEELAVGILEGPRSTEHRSIRTNHIAVHQMAHHIADEDRSLQVAGEDRRLAKTHPARGREMPRLFRVIGASLGFGDGEDLRHVSMVGDAPGDGHRREPRVTPRVGQRQEAVLDVVDVVGREPTAPGIKHEAESAAGPGGQFDLAGVRIEGKIVVTQHDRQSLPERRREPTAIAAVGHVDPAVEVIAEAVGQRIADAEPQPTEDNRAPVGASVAIGVLKEDDLRRGQREDAVAPW